MWLVRRSDTRLLSLATGEGWIPNTAMRANVTGFDYTEGDADGIYAFKDAGRAIALGEWVNSRFCYQIPVAIGTVHLWGDMVEHESGWRASRAAVRSVDWVFGGSPDLLARLRETYGVTDDSRIREPWPIGDALDKCICVIGHQRSGTSALTYGFRALGIDLGGRLMGSDAMLNPSGFGEDLDTVALNINMLGALKIRWYAGVSIGPSEIELLRRMGWIERGVHLIRHKTKGRLFGMKDPRMCVLIPVWRQIFREAGVRPGYVLALRHPLSVRSSMERMEGFDASRTPFFWTKHTLECLSGLRDNTAIIVDYDRLLDSPAEQLSRIAAAHGLTVDHHLADAYSDRFLRKDLRHSRYAMHSLCEERGLVQEMYGYLMQAAEDEVPLSRIITGRLPAWQSEFEEWRRDYLAVHEETHTLWPEDAALIEKIEEARMPP